MGDRPDDHATGLSRHSLSAVKTVPQLAELLRRLRRRAARREGATPLTYRELAAKTGWSRGVIGEYFVGRVLPPADRFDVLVRLLGATPDEQGWLATARDRVDEERRGGAGGSAEAFLSVRQLPPAAPGFAGRVAALAELDRLLAPGTLVATVSGTAGVGNPMSQITYILIAVHIRTTRRKRPRLARIVRRRRVLLSA